MAKTAYALALGALALVQLYVPVSMILEREEVLNEGAEFRFRTAPVDPNDPFRGKYITLDFTNNTIAVSDGQEWRQGEEVYVLLEPDSAGFASITAASKTRPSGDGVFMKASVRFVYSGAPAHLVIDYPFDRYYMEETRAYPAEQIYRESQSDTTSTTYALVSVKAGEAVLKDVLIDGVPISKLVEQRMLENE